MSESKDVKKDDKKDTKTDPVAPKAKLNGLMIAAIALLVVLIGLGAVFTKKPLFGLDGIFGFYAVFGFISCIGFVVVSQFILGPLLKRKDTYYDD